MSSRKWVNVLLLFHSFLSYLLSSTNLCLSWSFQGFSSRASEDSRLKQGGQGRGGRGASGGYSSNFPGIATVGFVFIFLCFIYGEAFLWKVTWKPALSRIKHNFRMPSILCAFLKNLALADSFLTKQFFTKIFYLNLLENNVFILLLHELYNITSLLNPAGWDKVALPSPYHLLAFDAIAISFALTTKTLKCELF